jgi:ABC-type sugar transport system permease subunit
MRVSRACILWRVHPVFVYNNRGTVYNEKRDYDRAIADYTETIRLNPMKAACPELNISGAAVISFVLFSAAVCLAVLRIIRYFVP